MRVRTPIMLITGSLGSGKTTLLRRIVEVMRQPIAVVMNEFGEAAIDSRTITGDNVRIVELAGGCICCSMTGDFEAAVREIIGFVRPEFIVVETTGVSDADALVFQVEGNLPEVRLDSVVHIVDAYLGARHPHVGPIARTHLQTADIVLINKIDLVTTQEVREMEALVRLHNDRALLVKTMGCDVDLSLLFGMATRVGAAPAIQRSPVHLQSFTYSTAALLDEGKFLNLFEALGSSVFRAKGFVRFPGVTHLFNYVLGRVDLEEYESEVTELIFIGCGLDEIREVIEGNLRDCEVLDAL
ncbi:MAG: GTP-binding protein [Syntrophobacteraceae bacterium]|nr:GTP-binding protein [Syntrophobacteraceae bacterium]